MDPGISSAPNVESKSAKKKKGKAEGAPTSPSENATPAADASAQALPSDLVRPDGIDSALDSPYMKELNK